MHVSAVNRGWAPSHGGEGWVRRTSHRAWLAISAAWAVFVGLLPHVLHHAGPLAGAALVAGLAGSLLFGVLGLVAAIPFLRGMYRRFGTWRAPVFALAVFAAVFSISTFVVGPRISGDEAPSASPAPAVDETTHEEHH